MHRSGYRVSPHAFLIAPVGPFLLRADSALDFLISTPTAQAAAITRRIPAMRMRRPTRVLDRCLGSGRSGSVTLAEAVVLSRSYSICYISCLGVVSVGGVVL
uniref:Uncharacterized protein n=1 Tax=Opuntia streptacantha TaxID=393608 RepID=A0A7C9EK85_OPUST